MIQMYHRSHQISTT